MEPNQETPTVFDAPPYRRGIKLSIVLLLLAFVVLLQLASRVSKDGKPQADTTSAELSARMAVALQSQAGQAAAEKTWVEVEKQYREALKSDPRSARALRGLAATLAMTGRQKEARRVVKASPDVEGERRVAWDATQAAFGARPRPPDPETLAEYRHTLDDPKFGWSRYVVLEKLASNPAEAARWRSRLEAEGMRAGAWAGLAGLTAVLAGLVGLVLLVRYLQAPPPSKLEPLGTASLALLPVFFLAFLGHSLVGPFLALPLKKVLEPDGELRAALVGAVLGGAVGLLFANWGLVKRGLSMSSLGWSREGAVRWGLGGYLAALPLVVAAAGVGVLGRKLLPGLETPDNPAAALALGSSGWQLALVIFVVAIVAPVVEEVLFRGLLFRSLSGPFGVWPAAALSSAVFAGMHPQIPWGFFNLFVVGVALAAVYRASGSLWPPIILHILNNGILMLLLLGVR